MYLDLTYYHSHRLILVDIMNRYSIIDILESILLLTNASSIAHSSMALKGFSQSTNARHSAKLYSLAFSIRVFNVCKQFIVLYPLLNPAWSTSWYVRRISYVLLIWVCPKGDCYRKKLKGSKNRENAITSCKVISTLVC